MCNEGVTEKNCRGPMFRPEIWNGFRRSICASDIDAAPAHYAVPDALALSAEEAEGAAALRTRLNPLSPHKQRLLLRAGYAGADASLRARGLAQGQPAASFDFLP